MARRWSKDDLGALREYMAGTTRVERSVEALASSLDRSPSSVILKLNRLGFKLRAFTDTEKRLIQEHYAKWNGMDYMINGLAERLGRHVTSICTYARSLGLTRQGRPHPWDHGIKLHRWKPGLIDLDAFRNRARKLYELPTVDCWRTTWNNWAITPDDSS